MSSLNDFDEEATSKSVVVALLVLAIFHNWQWTSPKQLSQVVLASLVCDVGLSDLAVRKKVSQMSAAELIEYEEHPLKGYLLLSKIKNIPDDVLMIVLQHHENEAGSGFPYKATKLTLHAYSRVVHTLFEYTELVQKMTSRQSIQECLDKMACVQKYLVSQQVLKTLYLIFEIPVPLDLQSVQLPSLNVRLS
ncbi:MAG: HD domain-containing phosphohydrolase [Pseudobdellovibrio sp.]